jgi:uncharacterized membrane protein HdeD (DUF308 family)
MVNVLTSGVRKSATWSIVLSLLMVVAGVLAIAIPLIGGVAVTVFVAWMLLFSAILHVGFAWRSRRAGTAVWEILLGILYGAIGFYLLVRPLVGLASLTLAIAAYLLVESVLEVVLSLRLRPTPGSGWLLTDGVVTLALAIMIWSTWPSSAAWVAGTLIGINLLVGGLTRLMFSMAVRRLLD